jgi:hypothetical protein
MENGMTQIEQMEKYSLGWGKEILESLTRSIPESKDALGLICDCQILERKIKQTSSLLEQNGEGDIDTVLTMKELIYINGALHDKYQKKR